VHECQVNDAVRCGGTVVQAAEVVQSPAVHLGVGRRQRCGSGVRAGEADDLMPCFENLPQLIRDSLDELKALTVGG